MKALLALLTILFTGILNISAQTDTKPLLKPLSFPQANKALINIPSKVTINIPNGGNNSQYPAKENNVKDDIKADMLDRIYNHNNNARRALL